MPAQGAVYIRDISGNIAQLDTSGRFLTTAVGSTSIVGSGSSYGYTLGTIESGGGGMNFSGAGVLPNAMMVYDLSGQNWNPVTSQASGGHAPIMAIGGPGQSPGTNIAAVRTIPADGVLATTDGVLETACILYGFDPLTPAGGTIPYSRLRVNASGDTNRLRVAIEGRAPTYTVTARNIGLSSGISMIAPQISIFNYGSGTAIQSGSAYKIKSLFIQPDPANTIASGGGPISFDVIRFTAFSGGGTALSGVAHDTSDPVYSGTLAAPMIQQKAYSGVVLDGLYFTYVTSNEGPYVTASGLLLVDNSVFDPAGQQNTNLIQSRMFDTKEVVIRSGYGFGVVQSSGYNYTQLFSGTFNYSLTYSVEG